MNRSTTPLIARFLSKVRILSASPDACWEWTASTASGYGRIGVGNRVMGAHRVAWELAAGPIPAGMCVLHTCDNPACVRPSHLELGTVADNHHDMAVRRRGHRSKTGLPYGVRRDGGKWRVQLQIDSRKKHLGAYNAIEEAAAVAQRERERLYG